MKKNLFKGKSGFIVPIGLATLFCVLCTPPIIAQEKEQDKASVAQEIANPLTTMIFIPIQYNFDPNMGVNEEGRFSSLYVQPIISFKLSEKWNLITRTIIPFYSLKDITKNFGKESGLGDINQSLFLSPSTSSESGYTWGVGSVLSYPTASNEYFKTGKLGVGPTGIALRVKGPLTYGMLANHTWSLGSNEYADVNTTFVQPFFDYTSKKAVTYELTTEIAYDWISDGWSVPLIFTANKLVVLGKQMFMIGGGARYWVDDNQFNPQSWGFNVSLYVLFPR